MSPPTRIVLILTSFLLSNLWACAHDAPRQLAEARKTYQAVQQGPAAEFNPAELHEAELALQLAEKTYDAEGDSERTTDRAYVAMRKAQRAEVEANTKATQAKIASLTERLTQRRGEQLASAQENATEQERLRHEAEERARKATEELSRIADVRQDDRGTVVTLSGSVLFATDQAHLLPAAQRRLEEVAKALQNAGSDAHIVVEGHTDSRGSADYNLELSAKRAEEVRNFLVSRGVEADRIRAEGLGLTRPVATNETAEGRANNRRVEIVIGPQG